MNWHHSGFNVYCGKAICPHNEDGLENLACYIIRASFSQERMDYIDDQVPALIESEISSKEFRKNWARLIHKIYSVNLLLCSKRSGSMRIAAFIEDEQLVKKILKSTTGGWGVKRKPPARANSPPPETFIIYDELSSPGADDYIIDADYPIDLSRRSS